MITATLSASIPVVEILGIRIHRVTMEKTLSLLEEMAAGREANHIVTVNPEFVMIAQHDPVFKDVLNNAALALPDGIGIVFASRLLGEPVPERVAGVDTIHRLANIAQRRGFSIFLLGASPGVAEKTAKVLQTENPGLRIAGTYAGSPHQREEDKICALIAAAKPDILLVAYGPPKQDLWIAKTQSRLGVPVAIGVGGTFDFIAGVTVRAPRWVRGIGLEWLYRLIKEPWRWRRMMTLPQFSFAVISKAIFS